MASLTQCNWVWVNSRSWRWTGRPGVLQFMGSQRVGHNWATELNWLDIRASLGAQTVKNLRAMRETWVWSLGREDPLEEEMATHPSILVWRIPWTEEPGRLESMGSQRVRHDLVSCACTHTHARTLDIEYGSLCYTVGPRLFVLCVVACIFFYLRWYLLDSFLKYTSSGLKVSFELSVALFSIFWLLEHHLRKADRLYCVYLLIPNILFIPHAFLFCKLVFYFCESFSVL